MGESKTDSVAFSREVLALLAQGASMAAPELINAEGELPVFTRIKGDGSIVTEPREDLLALPLRQRAKVNVSDVDALVRYINRFQTLTSKACQIVFAEITETGAAFTAVLDYHADGTAGANWAEHRCVYTCTPTPEWTRWLLNNGAKMSQASFAEFLEDNVQDVNPNNKDGLPTPADMIMISRSLTAKTASDFSQAIQLENGQVQFKYTETIEGKAQTTAGEVEIPQKFLIGIAPFVGFDGFEIWCRLKYRLTQGKLSLWYELERPHKIVEAAAKQAVATITEKTGLIPFRGSLVSAGLK